MRCSEQKVEVDEILFEACTSLLKEGPTHYQYLGHFSVAAKPKHHFCVLCGTYHLRDCLDCITLSVSQPPLRYSESLRLYSCSPQRLELVRLTSVREAHYRN